MEFVHKILNASLGKTHLFSLGQAGFIIKSASGQLLGIDMYLSNCVEREEGHMGFKRLLPQILKPQDIEFDCIVATHPHYDHFDIDAMPELMKNEKTKLFASINCAKEIETRNLQITSEKIKYIKPGELYTEGDFIFDFIPCDHGQGAPDAVGVVVTVDGKKICEVGDTCLRLDWIDMYQKKGSFDVLIAPINGAFGNLNEIDCAKLSGMLSPKVTIPCHYGMFASHGGNPGLFYDVMRNKYPNNKMILMVQGEEFIL